MYRAKSEVETVRRCAPHWGKLQVIMHAAVDPLCRLSNQGIADIPDRRPIAWRMTRLFPAEIRSILEWGLMHRGSITSIARHAHPDGPRRIISILSAVGNAETAEILRQYVDDPTLGKLAIDAIKKLANS